MTPTHLYILFSPFFVQTVVTSSGSPVPGRVTGLENQVFFCTEVV
jgi:hypothetical protein